MLLDIYRYGILATAILIAVAAVLPPREFSMHVANLAHALRLPYTPTLTITVAAFAFGWPLILLVLLADTIRRGPRG